MEPELRAQGQELRAQGPELRAQGPELRPPPEAGHPGVVQEHRVRLVVLPEVNQVYHSDYMAELNNVNDSIIRTL